MRFHHSTRRGRNRFGQAAASSSAAHHSAGHATSCGTGGKFGHHHPSALSSRWAQLSYCRQTNLHFNRRLPVELPEAMRLEQTINLLGFAGDPRPGAQKAQNSGELAANTSTTNTSTTSNSKAIQQQQQEASQQQATASLSRQVQSSLEQLDKLHLGQQQQQQRAQTTNRNHRPGSFRRAPPAPATNHKDEKHSPEVGPAAASATPTAKKLDLESAREKLVAQVEKHKFWSNKAARRMRLLGIHERQVYIYELVSYCERRDLEWRYEPYRGGRLAAGGSTLASSLAASGRRPLSSVSEISQATARATAASLRLAAASQPQTPSGLADPGGGPRPGHVFAFEQVAGATCGEGRRASAMRRSCSSVTSSPVHAATAGAGAAGKQHQPTGSQSAATSSPVRSGPAGQLATPTSLFAGALASALVESHPAPPSAELVWSIEPPEHLRPNLFASYLHTSEVPGTSFLKKCHGCEGRGRLKCSSCYGVGYEVCLSCTGKGTLRTYNSSLGGGALGASGRSGLGSRTGDSYASGRDSGGPSSMWDNANCDSSSSSMRLGGGRGFGEPGGITSDSGGLGGSSEVCANCSGLGQKRCWICAGRAYITCTACAGTGTLRCHLNLNITYINHRDELCLNNSDGIIPRERLKLSSGLLLADEIADRLAPLCTGRSLSRRWSPHRNSHHHHHNHHRRHQSTSGPPSGPNQPADCNNNQNQGEGQSNEHDEPAAGLTSQTPQATTTPPLEEVAKPMELSQLQAMSARLLEKHAETYLRNERLIKQRHKVTQIDCFKVDWEFRKKRGHFVVYGDEGKVYIAKYPFKTICNIT